ncbi:hypothetical protein J6352_09590 [Burkholderia pseudomallei]|uniref:hypothetical protein n=1 Tax=Burkholderia pseudomallei TaxID=28450 RepID=UPI001AD75E98|nr:hypothetical protein [Burkholderia pseudomallei]MBO7771592.1 hypothetical protein [Burkholderia pseudomallei]MBO7905635.1 hypothetical protein [Burkholderia pseudomallei]
MKNWLTSILRSIPVLGRLVDCSISDHAKAAKEFVIALAFSTVTFWLTSILLLPRSNLAATPYFDLLASTYANGELLIFSVSFIGPIFLATLVDRAPSKSQFPGKDWHVIFLIILAIIASALFSQVKMQALVPGAANTLDMAIVRTMSYILAGLAMLMRYLTFVYQKNMAAIDEYGPRGDKEFAEKYIEHAEEQGQRP